MPISQATTAASKPADQQRGQEAELHMRQPGRQIGQILGFG